MTVSRGKKRPRLKKNTTTARTLTVSLQPKQQEFKNALENYRVTFYGGARGGGKSYAMRNIMLGRRFQYPGTSGVIFRATYPELLGNIIRPLLTEHAGLSDYYRASDHVIELPNCSTLEFCHCQTEGDLYKYQGREWDDLGIEEAGNWPEEWVHRLRGSNRTSKQGIVPRTALTGNPGGLGHKWLKRLFVDRDYYERERPDDYFFIKALVYDNDALMANDPGYLDNLRAEPNEAIRRAFLEGDWDIFAGQYFGEWRREVHVTESGFGPERWWQRFGGYDHGFAHPAVFGAFAPDSDDNVLLYREWAANRHRPDEIASGIRDTMGDDWDLIRKRVYAGPDVFCRGRDGAPSVAEQFLQLPSDLQIVLIPANNDRIQGAQQVRRYLAWRGLPDGVTGPKLRVHPSCARTIECIPRMIHDDKRPEDVLKVDATEGDPWAGDDAYDMVRYALMSRPSMSLKPRDPVKWSSAEWFQWKMNEAKKAEKRMQRVFK